MLAIMSVHIKLWQLKPAPQEYFFYSNLVYPGFHVQQNFFALQLIEPGNIFTIISMFTISGPRSSHALTIGIVPRLYYIHSSGTASGFPQRRRAVLCHLKCNMILRKWFRDGFIRGVRVFFQMSFIQNAFSVDKYLQ